MSMPTHPKSAFSAKARLRRITTALHRWLGLLAFGQVLLWSIGGCLMFTLDFGDLYADPPPKPLPLSQATLSPLALQTRLSALTPGSKLTGAQIRNLAGELVYQLERTDGAPILLDASGRRLDPISPGLATRIAVAGYMGKGHALGTELLPKSTGNYISSVPIYRIDFDDAQHTEIYVDPASGSLLARRKALWGLYNRMWEFHLMKYTPSKAVNKALLLIFAAINVIVALTGFAKFFRRTPKLKNQSKPQTS